MESLGITESGKSNILCLRVPSSCAARVTTVVCKYVFIFQIEQPRNVKPYDSVNVYEVAFALTSIMFEAAVLRQQQSTLVVNFHLSRTCCCLVSQVQTKQICSKWDHPKTYLQQMRYLVFIKLPRDPISKCQIIFSTLMPLIKWLNFFFHENLLQLLKWHCRDANRPSFTFLSLTICCMENVFHHSGLRVNPLICPH